MDRAVAERTTTATTRHVPPRAGIRVAAQNHVNARADVAFSKEGVSFYFAVGEAF